MSNREPLREGVDYYLDALGRMVFTQRYHERRGYCCRSGCRHCPWGYAKCEATPSRRARGGGIEGDPM